MMQSMRSFCWRALGQYRAVGTARVFGRAAVLGALAAAIVAAAVWGAEPKADSSPRLTLGKAFACADYGGDKVCLVDPQGKIMWEYPAARPIDVWVLANGNILFSHVKGAKEVTRAKEVVWEFKTAEGNEVHACQPLPDGKVMVAESGPMRIVEVDRQGRVTKTVKLTTKCTATHQQMRGARKLPNGNYLVGQYADGVVREYGPTGDIVREFPHPVMGLRRNSLAQRQYPDRHGRRPSHPRSGFDGQGGLGDQGERSAGQSAPIRRRNAAAGQRQHARLQLGRPTASLASSPRSSRSPATKRSSAKSSTTSSSSRSPASI